MPTHSLDLFFATNQSDVPGPPVAEVQVKTYSRGGYKGFADMISITHRCLSLDELEQEIDRLKTELDEIGGEAKKKFAAAHLKSS